LAQQISGQFFPIVVLEDGMGVGHKQKCDILIENYGASNILSSF
jgi:hypothetical protein